MNKTLVVDSRISAESLKKLESMGYNAIKLPQNLLFDAPISSHPDIFMTQIDGKWFIDDAVHELFIFMSEFEIVSRGQAAKEKYKYPKDVFLNCVQVGKYLICNKKHTCKEVIDYAIQNEIKVIDVNQGYCKCSICVVSDNAIITEDTGIAKTLEENSELDVLLIEKGHVSLDGYNYGFFGGCCGLIENDLIAFNGSIEVHPEYLKIKSFCEKYCVNMVSLNDEKLYDIGTIFRII